MFADQIKQLSAFRTKVQALERSAINQLESELKQLPKRYGFADVHTFVHALKSSALMHKKISKKDQRSAPRKRAIITKATRAAVRNMANAGKPEAEIARVVGISVASVHNIKKTEGLIRSRS